MLIMPSFKKSLVVEQFQGNYLNCACISFLASIFWRLLIIYRCPDLFNTLRLNFSVAENITKEVSQCGFKGTQEIRVQCKLKYALIYIKVIPIP